MKTIQLVCLATLCSAIRAQSPLVRGGADKSFPTPSVDENIRKLNELHRNLQGIPCNVPYMTMTSEEITATLIQVFSIKLDVFGVSDADTIIQDYIPMIEHDVQFMKVCESCESQNLSGYGCDENDYGYDTTHSGLVLYPVDYDAENETASIIDAKRLQSWFHFRGVTVSPKDSYNWIYAPGVDTFEYALLSASFGYVSIAPEKTGYGEASSLVPSDLDKKSIVTATMPLYSYAKSFVETNSGGRTKLSNKAQYMGFSGGGFQAVAAADGFKAHGITPVKVLAGSAPLKLRSWTPMGFIRSLLVDGNSGPFDALNVALVTVSYSNTRPGAPNSGQSFLKPERVDKLLAMYQDLDAPSASFDPAGWFSYAGTNYPENFVDSFILSDNITAFYLDALAKNDTDPCLNNPNLESLGMDKICETLDENDLTNVVLEADYPIDLCFSKTDFLITIENVPDRSALKFELDGVDHSGATFICNAKLFGSNEIEKPTVRATEEPTVKASKAPKATKVKSQKQSKALKSSWEYPKAKKQKKSA